MGSVHLLLVTVITEHPVLVTTGLCQDNGNEIITIDSGLLTESIISNKVLMRWNKLILSFYTKFSCKIRQW